MLLEAVDMQGDGAADGAQDNVVAKRPRREPTAAEQAFRQRFNKHGRPTGVGNPLVEGTLCFRPEIFEYIVGTLARTVQVTLQCTSA